MIKLTVKNLRIIINAVLSQMEDENGRGEFDKETGIINAITKMCQWFESDITSKNLLEK